jgi:hypothetical protein
MPDFQLTIHHANIPDLCSTQMKHTLIKSPFIFLYKPIGFFSMVAWNLAWLPGLLALVFPTINKAMAGLALTNWNLPINLILGYVFGSLVRYIFGLIL